MSKGFLPLEEQLKNIVASLTNISQVRLKFSMLEFLFFGACAAYYPFIVLFMQTLGFNNTIIGIIVAINSFIVIFSPIFWGIVSDWTRSVRKVFIMCISVASLLLLSLPFLQSVLLIGILLSLVTFFESTLAPLLDAWVVRGINHSPAKIDYGSIRVWGSIGYALMIYIFTLLIQETSVATIFPFYGVMAFFAVILLMRTSTEEPLIPLSFRELKPNRLFKNRKYIIFIIISTLIMIPHRATFIFLPNIVESVGGQKEQVGMLFSLVAISEIPMFLISAKLNTRFKPIHLIIASTIFFVLRQVFYFLATTPFHIVLIQLTQGPSFALYLSGMVYYLYSLAPLELKSTAQTMAASLSFGLSGIIGSFGGGWFIDNFGLKHMYFWGMLASIVASLLFLASFSIENLIIKKGCLTLHKDQQSTSTDR
jgi:PPP family 3-phenylpropionic acid transporter